ncbi:hemerythrin domain-containing protein [Paenibacillus oenotherae]|uniref:Hemerythrin domain-containing protein n=1 Tax=Paenibacillus oenotherae TaxID=1435645 RepID=A0ABS7DB79_9BACL|nr:hemerythrin domain-containing protein [Paenibacillus oenotherae]MBW7477151.1 hemerythrin domain-containing protein [Paenibacillus oenotherae]
MMKEARVQYDVNIGQPQQDWLVPVQHLKEEHEALLTELQTLYLMARRIGSRPVIDAVTLRKLRGRAAAFQQELAQHAKWEEETLFPQMTAYYGEELNQFTLIEQEHLLAEQFVQAFVDAVERAPVRSYEAHEMASYLNQALEVLQGHFGMEEALVAELVDRSNHYGY